MKPKCSRVTRMDMKKESRQNAPTYRNRCRRYFYSKKIEKKHTNDWKRIYFEIDPEGIELKSRNGRLTDWHILVQWLDFKLYERKKLEFTQGHTEKARTKKRNLSRTKRQCAFY